MLTKRHRTNYNNSIRIQFLDCTGDDPVLRLFMRRKNTAQGFFPHVFSKDKHRNDNGLSFHHRPGTSSLVYLYWLVFFFRMQANVAINPAKAKQHRENSTGDVTLTADTKKCVSCMRCVKLCPHNARKVNGAMVSVAALAIKKACSPRKENELFM